MFGRRTLAGMIDLVEHDAQAVLGDLLQRLGERGQVCALRLVAVVESHDGDVLADPEAAVLHRRDRTEGDDVRDTDDRGDIVVAQQVRRGGPAGIDVVEAASWCRSG